MGAAGGTLADQWKEFFYCEAMDKEVMVVKGTKRSSSRSSNKHGSDNVISMRQRDRCGGWSVYDDRGAGKGC